MEQAYILRKEFANNRDPHGYYNFDRLEANYKSPSKRSFLTECIRQIYIMNGITMPLISMPVEYNKAVIWHRMNNLMRPARITVEQAAMQKVKRRLFRETKPRPRKCPNPQYKQTKLTECLQFRTSRYEWGVRKIRRNYLDQARKDVEAELRQQLKRKHSDQDDDDDESDIDESSVQFNNNDDVFQVSQQDINEISSPEHPQTIRSIVEQLQQERTTEAYRLSRRAKKMEEMLIDQQHYKRSKANDKVLESSIRSILYIKTLMSLMVGEQENHNRCA
ncbi:uncharacterized protein LOC135950513 [Calliphora vicina]|uniref:uncharacterized protein LOC135950513 n=1 Tax=Calliphora vicina TaxID=7373 RepID=UPI00325BE890